MMKSRSGKILYVGKAKSIRHRVQSYFRPSAKPHGKTGLMLRFDPELQQNRGQRFVNFLRIFLN